MARFTNYYSCDKCDTEWSDTWDCMCDDRCPNCNTSISPYESDDHGEDNDDDDEDDDGRVDLDEDDLEQIVRESLAGIDADTDYVGTKDRYTHSEAAVALMLWESYVDMDVRRARPDSLAEIADDYGAGTVREFMLPLAVLVELMWVYSGNKQGNALDDWSFDWEVCPAVIEVIDWHKVCFDPKRLPTKEELFAQVLKHLRGELEKKKPASPKGRQLTL